MARTQIYPPEGDEPEAAAARAAAPTARQGKRQPVSATGMSPTDPRPSDGNEYEPGIGPLGVDLSTLADLPQDVRRRATEALYALEAAMRSGNDAATKDAAARLTRVMAELQDLRAEAVADKMFKAALSPVRGDHAVMRKFAERAGVRP